jgi:hypothetical protein
MAVATYVGPHERCGSSPSNPKGVNPVPQTHGKIQTLKISPSGSFSGRREYRATHKSAYFIYYFDWDIRVSGRFVSASKAKGTVTYEMVRSGTRGSGEPRSCGRRTVSWTATVG